MRALIRIFMQTSLDEIHLDKIVIGRSILISCKCLVFRSGSVQLIADADPCPLALQTFSWVEGYKASLSGVAHERRMVPVQGSWLQPMGHWDLMMLSRTVVLAEGLESTFNIAVGLGARERYFCLLSPLKG